MNIPSAAIISYLLGEANDGDIRALQQWIHMSPENEATFRELEAIWHQAGRLDPATETTTIPSVAAIIRLAARKTAAARTVAAMPRPRATRISSWRSSFNRPLGWSLAAAALTAIVLVPFLGDRARTAFGAQEFRTGSGERATVRFSDGTIVRVAPETSLTVMNDSDQREVWLDGQAYFAVTPNPAARFVVRTSAGVATVLGTRFNVRAQNGGLHVAVVEGEVSVSGTDGEASVKANQIGRVVDGRKPAVQTVEDVYEEISWLGNFLGVESSSLASVIIELERRFDLHVEVLDDVLLERTVTGWFTDQDATEILAGICRAVDARCTVRDSLVVMEAVDR